jgi:hypothetical protein
VSTHKKCVLSIECVLLLGDTEVTSHELGGAGGGHKKCVLSIECVLLLGDTEATRHELGGAGGGGQVPVQTLGVVPGKAHITKPNTSTNKY